MRKYILVACLLLPTVALAQEPAPSVAVTVLQNTVGQMAGQNALLLEQVQKLSAENAELKKQLAAHKTEPKKPEPKK